MKIALITIGYNQLSEQVIDSAFLSAYDLYPVIFIHSTNPQVLQAARYAVDQGAVVYDYGVNRGVSRSWNDGILIGTGQRVDHWLIFNDDIIFPTGDVDRLIEAAAANPSAPYVTASGIDNGRPVFELGFSCFVLNKSAINSAGFFDRNFWPAYYEDNDYDYRLKLLGQHRFECHETSIYHNRSATIRSDGWLAKQNQRTFMLNQAYYQSKWGGLPGGERFRVPFGDPKMSPQIKASKINYPYGKYDRDLSFALEMV